MSRNRYAFAQGNPVNYQDPSGHRVASDLAIALFIASRKGTSHFTTTIHRTDLNEVLQRNPDYYHHYSDNMVQENMVLDIYNEIVCILNGFELGLELKKSR